MALPSPLSAHKPNRKALAKKAREKKLAKNSADLEVAIGVLVTNWANCETWFMRVFAILMRVDTKRADLMFASIGSFRGRLELVQRAAIMCLARPRDVRLLQKLCREFRSVTELRNKVCHGEYSLDPSRTYIVGIWSSNFSRSDFNGTNQYEHRYIDRGFINEMTNARTRAYSLAGRLQRFVKTKAEHVLEQPRDTPLRLPKPRKAKGRPRRQ